MSNEKLRAVLLFGAPGSGKGTQGKLLGKIKGFFHVSSGEIIRSLEPGSDEDQLCREYATRGKLVPDDFTIRIWRNWTDTQIAEEKFDPEKQLLLLDGIPRNVNQCQLLEEHIEVIQLIHLACSEDQPLIDRIKQRGLKEGRADDTDEAVIRNRFTVYREETAPILDYYPAVVRSDVDPMGTPAEVLKSILQVLFSRE